MSEEKKGPQVKCSRCNTEFSLGEYQFCPHCGEELPQSCPDCGREVERLSEGCPYCGGKKEEDPGKTVMVWGGPPDPDPPEEENTDLGLPSVIVDMGSPSEEDSQDEAAEVAEAAESPSSPKPPWLSEPVESTDDGLDEDEEKAIRKLNLLQLVALLAVGMILLACGGGIFYYYFYYLPSSNRAAQQQEESVVISAEPPSSGVRPARTQPPPEPDHIPVPVPSNPAESGDGGVGNSDGSPAEGDGGSMEFPPDAALVLPEAEIGPREDAAVEVEDSWVQQVLANGRYSFPVTGIAVGRDRTIWWTSSRYRCLLAFNAAGEGVLLEAMVDNSSEENRGWMYVTLDPSHDRYLFLDSCEGESKTVARIPWGYQVHHGQSVVQGPGEVRAYHYVELPPSADE